MCLARGALLNLVMLNAVGSLLATPLWGHLSDRYGRRRLIMLGCGVMVLYPFVYFVRLSDIRRLARRLLEGRIVPGYSTRARLNVVERVMP